MASVTSIPAPRRLACARCGVAFGCDLSKDCWCGQEAARLPLPASGTGFADCLCRDCLRVVAEAHDAANWAISAVLLDMDGTLLDTERVYRTSLCNALADLGYGDGTEIARARTQMKAGLLMGLESPSSRAERLARLLAIWDRVPDLEETIQKIDAVDLPSIRAYAEKLVTEARVSMALYGPVAGRCVLACCKPLLPHKLHRYRR